MPIGARVEVLGTCGSWTKVKFGSRIGYMMSQFLAAEEPLEPDEDLTLEERVTRLEKRVAIGQVDSEELQMVLIYRYMEGMTWDEIGELFHADKSTIKRWHWKAIEQIVLPEERNIKKNRISAKDEPK